MALSGGYYAVAVSAAVIGAMVSIGPAGWITITAIVGTVTISNILYKKVKATKKVKVNQKAVKGRSRQSTKSGKAKIPEKIKSGGKVKMPSKYPNEYEKQRGGGFKHKKMKWELIKSNEKHYGDHWHLSPPNGKWGNYYNIGSDGKIIN